ncbi:MAG: ATP-binding protein, partial [Phenylobacterium sp.]
EPVMFVPVIDSVVAVGELVIATLLFAQASIFRSRALLALGAGFVFIALLLVSHALTFPGAFSQEGLFSPGLNGTAWVMIFRRVSFPIVVIGYVLLRDADEKSTAKRPQPPSRAFTWTLGATLLAVAVTLLTLRAENLLPPIFVNRSDAIYFNLTVFNLTNVALLLLAMAVLHARRRSVLDMWLQVALAGWLIQSALNLTLTARFTVGWYGLFVVILLSHVFVLLALLLETNRLYTRLARATAAHERERASRMMSMEAVAAAISHEVGQPLTAANLSATACLRSLTRSSPDPERALKSLRDSIEASRRAFEVMRSIRSAFADGSRPQFAVSLNVLVRDSASMMSRGLAARNISLRLALDETLPPIRANKVQIERVLSNLLTNAMEAVERPGLQPRSITIRTSAPDSDSVLLEVSDSGAGIPPDKMAQIFEPFFTTKSAGTGLGLSLSRTIVQEHKGRLWATPNVGRGATFSLQLPRAGAPATQH